MSETTSVSIDAPMQPHAVPARKASSPSKDSQTTKTTPKRTPTLTQAQAAAALQAPVFQSTLAWPHLRAASYLGSPYTSDSSLLNQTVSALMVAGMTGAAGGIGIAVIDSGIVAGPEFENRIVGFYDFTEDIIEASGPLDPDGHGTTQTVAVNSAPVPRMAITDAHWRKVLPVLEGNGFTLRELRITDATTLLSLLTTEEVTRFISPPPTTIEGFERFIHRAQREREAGRYVCFAVVPTGYDDAVGLFQTRQLDPTFGTAEWGFALGSAFRGSGLFVSGADLMIDFAFDVIGVHRLEARAAVENGAATALSERLAPCGRVS